MDLLIEHFLADTNAVQPVRNLAFDPALFHPEAEGLSKSRSKSKSDDKAKPKLKTATTTVDDPKVLGWKLRGCSGTVTDGILSVTANSDAPFLGFAAGKFTGPTVVKFRIRSSTAREGKVEWLPSPAANDKAQSVPYQLANRGWQNVTVTLPAEGTLGIVRLYLPTPKEPVQIDSIELRSSHDKHLSDF